MAEKSSLGTRQTDGKILVWFGEIERNLAKLLLPTFTTVLNLNYFVDLAIRHKGNYKIEQIFYFLEQKLFELQ
jgi:hypothetical protein